MVRSAEFVSDRPYADVAKAMSRILGVANAAEADKGRISIGPINRIMLNEGASVGIQACSARSTRDCSSCTRAGPMCCSRLPGAEWLSLNLPDTSTTGTSRNFEGLFLVTWPVQSTA